MSPHWSTTARTVSHATAPTATMSASIASSDDDTARQPPPIERPGDRVEPAREQQAEHDRQDHRAHRDEPATSSTTGDDDDDCPPGDAPEAVVPAVERHVVIVHPDVTRRLNILGGAPLSRGPCLMVRSLEAGFASWCTLTSCDG